MPKVTRLKKYRPSVKELFRQSGHNVLTLLIAVIGIGFIAFAYGSLIYEQFIAPMVQYGALFVIRVLVFGVILLGTWYVLFKYLDETLDRIPYFKQRHGEFEPGKRRLVAGIILFILLSLVVYVIFYPLLGY